MHFPFSRGALGGFTSLALPVLKLFSKKPVIDANRDRRNGSAPLEGARVYNDVSVTPSDKVSKW